jgi:hypothetical protein
MLKALIELNGSKWPRFTILQSIQLERITNSRKNVGE